MTRFLTPILKRSSEILIHIGFWIGVYFFYTYFLGYGSNNTAYVNHFSWFLLPVTILMSYFFHCYLIPKYLHNKQPGLFLLYSCYTLIISFFLIAISILYGFVFSHHYLEQESVLPLTKGLVFIILVVYLVVFISIILSFLRLQLLTDKKNEAVKHQFLATQLQLKDQELRFLKMQIHPHFLFNTLNTMYGFALKKADETPDMILKLSQLLDYILYQIEKPTVSLADEIQHIKNYIALEKMRFQESLQIDISTPQLKSYQEIPPMLFLPFVENAFKHGSRIDGVLQVSISLLLLDNHLEFTVVNSTRNQHSNHTGIGLENIRKRLKMIFKDTYDLQTERVAETFTATLKIPLSNDL
jgi:sensor histidine kinase YesM